MDPFVEGKLDLAEVEIEHPQVEIEIDVVDHTVAVQVFRLRARGPVLKDRECGNAKEQLVVKGIDFTIPIHIEGLSTREPLFECRQSLRQAEKQRVIGAIHDPVLIQILRIGPEQPVFQGDR